MEHKKRYAGCNVITGVFTVFWAVIPGQSQVISWYSNTVSSYFSLTFRCNSLLFQVTLVSFTKSYTKSLFDLFISNCSTSRTFKPLPLFAFSFTNSAEKVRIGLEKEQSSYFSTQIVFKHFKNINLPISIPWSELCIAAVIQVFQPHVRQQRQNM